MKDIIIRPNITEEERQRRLRRIEEVMSDILKYPVRIVEIDDSKKAD